MNMETRWRWPTFKPSKSGRSNRNDAWPSFTFISLTTKSHIYSYCWFPAATRAKCSIIQLNISFAECKSEQAVVGQRHISHSHHRLHSTLFCVHCSLTEYRARTRHTSSIDSSRVFNRKMPVSQNMMPGMECFLSSAHRNASMFPSLKIRYLLWSGLVRFFFIWNFIETSALNYGLDQICFRSNLILFGLFAKAEKVIIAECIKMNFAVSGMSWTFLLSKLHELIVVQCAWTNMCRWDRSKPLCSFALHSKQNVLFVWTSSAFRHPRRGFRRTQKRNALNK